MNADTIQPLENHFVADGTAGPANNRWGDFLTSRRSHPAGNTWAATGFVLNGGQANTDSEARFLWFGRERDAPDVTTICDHKMHWPQLPDPNGWDVRVFEPKILADDWRCSETGGVDEIYFWGSWREDLVGQVTNIHVSIHSDIPDPDGDGQLYSMPGDLLWERDFPPGEGPGFFTYEPGGKGDQGWYDPNTGEYYEHDHTQYFKYKIVDIPEPFKQQEGTIYWLDIQVIVAGPEEFGWKTTPKPFNDDAVWGDWNPVEDPNGIVWSELREPITFESLDLAFYINGQALVDPKIPTVSEWGLIITSLLLVSGGTALIVRRRARLQPV